MNSDTIEIVEYKDEYKEFFVSLNKAWITRYFKMESVDEKVFANPKAEIVEKGGFIFFALVNGIVAGTVSLLKINATEYAYELAKLAVDEKYQGFGLGKRLCIAAIKKAKVLSPKKIYLESNTKLKPAISLYRKLGFSEIKGIKPMFDWVDIQMQL